MSQSSNPIQQSSPKQQYIHTCKKDMIVGLTYLLLMACDTVRNSSQAPTNDETATIVTLQCVASLM